MCVCVSVQNAGVVVMTDGHVHESEHSCKSVAVFFVFSC